MEQTRETRIGDLNRKGRRNYGVRGRGIQASSVSTKAEIWLRHMRTTPKGVKYLEYLKLVLPKKVIHKKKFKLS